MFSLRQIFSNVKKVVPIMRHMASQSGPLTDLTVDNDGIATLTLQRMPVNSLNLDLLQDISKSFDEVSKNKARALILTSASPTVFSAGLDIMEMYKPDLNRAEAFWSTLQEVWLKLFGSNYITAAVINGHAPGGGCLFALSCDFRTMVQSTKSVIGLNEAALGIWAPPWTMDTMTHTIPMRHAELALTTAKLFTVDEALEIGIIDDIANDKQDAMDKCKEFIRKFDNIPPLGRSLTKRKLRERIIQKFLENRQEDTEMFLNILKNPEVQQNLEVYIQKFKQKKRS